MKRYLTYILLLLTSASAYAQPRYEGVVRVDDCALTEQGDGLNVRLGMHISKDAARWSDGVLITPVLSDGDSLRCLPEVMVLGRNEARAYRRGRRVMARHSRPALPATLIETSPKTDTLLRYSTSLGWAPWMDDARLALYVETFTFRGKRHLITMSLPGGVETVSTEPYKVQPRVETFAPARENKSRSRQGAAYLDFRTGQSVILPYYRRNPEELAKIRTALSDVAADPSARVTGMFIEGFASIEGMAVTNLRLSRARAEALRTYIVRNFTLPVSSSSIRVDAQGEDWAGLAATLKESNIPYKEEALRIIETIPVEAGRETALMSLGGGVPYRMMLRDLFPQQRRVEYRVDYAVRDFSLEESRDVLGRNPASLSELELYTLAMNYGEGTEEFNRILGVVAPQYFPQSPTAAINAAGVMIATGELATAERLLAPYKTDPRAAGNIGAMLLMRGRLDEAEQWLQRAAGSKAATENLRELQTKRAEDARQARRRNR